MQDKGLFKALAIMTGFFIVVADLIFLRSGLGYMLGSQSDALILTIPVAIMAMVTVNWFIFKAILKIVKEV